jgi:hypothetical protein
MKNVFLALIISTFSSCYAYAAWNAIINCENGGFVIDENRYSCQYGTCVDNQLVIRNQSAVNEIIKRNGVDPSHINANHEVILPGVLFEPNKPEAVVTMKTFGKGDPDSGGFAFVVGLIRRNPDNTYNLQVMKANLPPTENRQFIMEWIFRDCR